MDCWPTLGVFSWHYKSYFHHFSLVVFLGHNLRIVKDGCGIFAVILTWLLIIFAEFIIWGILLLPSYDRLHSIVNGVIFQFITCLAAISHLRAMFTDPVCFVYYLCLVTILLIKFISYINTVHTQVISEVLL